MKLSVFIPTKNAGALFESVLDKLRTQQGVEMELIVVDSGSTDQTLELARRAGARIHTIAPSEFNHGLTRDLGISLANNDVVVLMTQDAEPGDDQLLARLAGAFADPAVAGAYVRQVARPEADVLTKRNLAHAPTGRLQDEVRGMPMDRTWEQMHWWERFSLCNYDDVCSAMRKSVWRSIPYGRVDFGEDIVWSQKVLRAGHKIAYVGQTHVVHSHDRPIKYDYRRTYLTHNLLYRQYEMATVPSFVVAVIQAVRTAIADARYVWVHEPSRRRRLDLLLTIPVLAITGVFGQYFGARDARLGRGKTYSDI